MYIRGGPNPRRFQQSSKFIFTMYTMQMKRKLGGVAYVAQKKSSDGSVGEREELPNTHDINKLLNYQDEKVKSSVSEVRKTYGYDSVFYY